MQPFFSIIMPTYNRLSFLRTSIQSVLDQTYPHWELLIIDDGSTDATEAFVTDVEDKRIRYQYQENKGKSEARNRAIDLSRGRYIAFLDSDDEYQENHLEIHKKYIDQHNQPVALFYTQGYFRSGQQEVLPDPDPLNLEDLSFQRCPMTLAITIHRDILEKNRFEERLAVRQDAELWDRIRRQKFPFIRIPEYTGVANLHEGNSRKDIYDYYNNLEYAIMYYVRDRFTFSREEYRKLKEVFHHLAYQNYWRGNLKSSVGYLMKELLIYPFYILKRGFWGLLGRYFKVLMGKRRNISDH